MTETVLPHGKHIKIYSTQYNMRKEHTTTCRVEAEILFWEDGTFDARLGTDGNAFETEYTRIPEDFIERMYFNVLKRRLAEKDKTK